MIRVAILGGGCGGCAAAHALSKTPELRERFEVTIFEGSHRLGGKGATGRDPRVEGGQAVLEHGLHVWMGWYHRAFAAMHDVLETWQTLPGRDNVPFVSVEQAFEPSYQTAFPHPRDSDRLVTLTLPPRPGVPGREPGRLDRLALIGALVKALPTMAQEMGALDRELRRLLLALGAAVTRGLARDVVGKGPAALDALDEFDLRQWLRRHGASEAVCNAPPIRAFYDLAFAYPDGVSGPGQGSVAAGAALASIARIFASYRGAPFWRMRAGMGDTVFAPMFEVLRSRGVNVRFFHAVEDLHVHDRRIASVDLRVTAPSRGHRPLVDLALPGGRVLPVWPEQPLFEHPGEMPRMDEPTSLRLETGHDFDHVVLAIPAPALVPITSEVRRASPAFDRMLDHARGVATRSVQLWFEHPPSPERFGPRSVCTGTPGRFASWADMSDVLAFERWQGSEHGDAQASMGPPATALLYGCDVDPGPVAQPACNELLADLEAQARSQAGVRFFNGRADAPVRHAYVRRNLEPWEQYCLTLPGSTGFRLGPDESGISNLLLAGDWVRTTINGGSVEAAFEAGERAAETLIRQ